MVELPTPTDYIALQQVLNELWLRTDRVVDRKAEELFAEQGEMRIGSLKLQGRNAINQYNVDRRKKEDETGRRVRHFCTNIIVEHYDGQHAAFRCTLLVFQGVGNVPFQASLPSNIADFLVEFQKSGDDNWLISKLEGAAIFVGPGAPENAR